MSRNINREEAMRKAAEKMRQKKEQEEREEKEFYQRITSGVPWLLFKSVVVFCTLLIVVTTIDQFVDGSSRKLTEDDWEINRNWEWTWHKILDVENGMFAPEIGIWGNRVENSVELIYSPILRSGKKLRFDIQMEGAPRMIHEETRWRSIFSVFPAFQIILLIPLLTYIFRRQKPWFNFARVASLVLVFPGALLVLYFTMF
jgi:hypothetical protein